MTCFSSIICAWGGSNSHGVSTARWVRRPKHLPALRISTEQLHECVFFTSSHNHLPGHCQVHAF